MLYRQVALLILCISKHEWIGTTVVLHVGKEEKRRVQIRLAIIVCVAIPLAMLLGIMAVSQPTTVRARGNSATPTLNPKVNAKYVGGIQAAKTPVANKLLPLDASKKLPLAVIPQGSGSGLDADRLDGMDSAALQKRVTDACAAGSAIRVVNANGTVGCQAAGMVLPFHAAASDSSPLLQISNDNGDGVRAE